MRRNYPDIFFFSLRFFWFEGNRSPADELYVRHIIESARGANAMAEPPQIYPRSVLEQLTGDYSGSSGGKSQGWVPEPGCGLKILDLRPRAAAMANRTGGECCHNISVDVFASGRLVAQNNTLDNVTCLRIVSFLTSYLTKIIFMGAVWIVSLDTSIIHSMTTCFFRVWL